MPRPEPGTDLLFVYGTLRSEFENACARRLRAEAEFLGPAEVRGSIFHVAHYPGFRTEPAGTVKGELYRLRTAEATLADLDIYEGDEYVRELIAILPTGNEAWIYRYATPLAAERRIDSGDFTRP